MTAGWRKKKNRWKPEKRRQATPTSASAKPKPEKKPKPAKPAKVKKAKPPKEAKAKRVRKEKPPKPAKPPRPPKPKKPAGPRPEPMGLGPLAPLAALLVVCGLLFFVGLGERSLWESDESRYGEIAREMVVSGDWVTPRLNTLKYFEKPPLTYWLTSISYKLFGINARATRLVPAFFASLTVLLIYFLGRLWWGWREGFVAGLLLCTSLMFMVLARVVLVDMVMCFGVVLAMYGFFAHLRRYRHGIWAFWLGLTAGFLSKGLLGPGLPVLACLIFLAVTRRWKESMGLLRPWGPGLFVLLCAPWVALVSIRNPEFFQFFFIDEHFGRLLTTRHQRWEPYYFYFLVVPAAFFPWMAFSPWAVARQWTRGAMRTPENQPFLFAFIWFAAFFGFFTLSSSKMVHYALPMMPALALLTARPLAELGFAHKGSMPSQGLQRCLLALAGMLILGAAVAMLSPAFIPDVSYAQVGIYLLAAPLMLSALGLAIFALRRRGWMVWAAPFVTFALLAATFWLAALKLEPYRSVAGLVERIKPHFKYGDRLATYRDFYNGAAFYSEKRVVIVRHWGELRFGFDQDPKANYAWFIPNDDFLFKMLGSPTRRWFVICLEEYYPQLERLSQGKYQVPIFVWAKMGDKVLFSNRPPR